MNFDSKFNNQLTAFLAAAIGLFMFLDQIFPELQNNLNMINTNLMQLIPVEYQSIVQIILTGLSIIVAIIVYVYNYTTSQKYAQDHAQHKIRKYKQLHLENEGTKSK
jgi:hypothetical protein